MSRLKQHGARAPVPAPPGPAPSASPSLLSFLFLSLLALSPKPRNTLWSLSLKNGNTLCHLWSLPAPVSLPPLPAWNPESPSTLLAPPSPPDPFDLMPLTLLTPRTQWPLVAEPHRPSSTSLPGHLSCCTQLIFLVTLLLQHQQPHTPHSPGSSQMFLPSMLMPLDPLPQTGPCWPDTNTQISMGILCETTLSQTLKPTKRDELSGAGVKGAGSESHWLSSGPYPET